MKIIKIEIKGTKEFEIKAENDDPEILPNHLMFLTNKFGLKNG